MNVPNKKSLEKLMSKKPKIIDDDNINFSHRQRKLHYLKARRQLRRLEIMMARTRSLARVFSVIFLFCALIYLIYSPLWYLNPSIFSVYPNNYLEIEGNEIVSHKQILTQLSKIKFSNKPIYMLDTNPLEQAILKLTPVKKVYIRRFWFPARLKIVIDEKTPILGISPSPSAKPISVFTEDITIINKDFLPLPESKKVFLVLTYDDFNKWPSKNVNYLIYLCKLIEGFTRQKLVYLDIRNPNDVFVQLNEVKLRLGELDRTTFIRTKRIGDVLDESLKIKNDIDYIDLRWNKTISIKLKNKQEAQINKDNKASSEKDKPKENKKATNKKKI